MSIHDYTLSVFSSVESGMTPKVEMGFSARKTDLRWTISDQGGYLDLECGFSSQYGAPVVGLLPVGIDLNHRDHVVVRRGSRIVWEGRVVEREFGAAGQVSGIIAEGYVASLNDDWSRITTTTSVTSGDALEAIIAAIAPHINIGNAEQWIDPLVTHAQTLVQVGEDSFGSPVYENRGGMRDWYKLTGGEAVDLVLKEGNADKQPLVFMVLAGPTAYLLPKVAPEEPHYRTAFDPIRMTWHDSSREMVSHVTVEYQEDINTEQKTYSIGLTVEAETAGFVDDYGFARHLLIPAGQMVSSGAIALRDTTLTRGSQPFVQSTIQATGDQSTWLARSGVPWPFDAVLPGEWVNVAERGLQPIVAVTVDASAGIATYELGGLDPYMPKNQMIREIEVSRRMTRLVNFFSGGRMR